jgi:4-hydroxybenzoate polyprenyltransferase
MLTRIRHLLELIRFSHTVFALPFALLAALMAWRIYYVGHAMSTATTDGSFQTWLAEYPPSNQTPLPTHIGNEFRKFRDSLSPGFWIRWQELVGILLCMVTGRSAAMSFNRLADRNIDALNPRTASRHLPAGILSVSSVVWFAALSSAAFVASNLIFLPNRLPLFLAVPMLLFLLGYSYTKRFTALAHFWLGAALGLAPISAWIAIRGEIVMVNPRDLLPVLFLGGAVMFWVAGFDIIYACQDVDFDRRQHLHSIPARFGVKMALDIAATCHLAMVVLLALVPLVYPLDWIPWAVGVAAIAVLLVYEHSLVKPTDLARVNAAFFNVNAVVSMGLLAIGAVALWF